MDVSSSSITSAAIAATESASQFTFAASTLSNVCVVTDNVNLSVSELVSSAPSTAAALSSSFVRVSSPRPSLRRFVVSAALSASSSPSPAELIPPQHWLNNFLRTYLPVGAHSSLHSFLPRSTRTPLHHDDDDADNDGDSFAFPFKLIRTSSSSSSSSSPSSFAVTPFTSSCRSSSSSSSPSSSPPSSSSSKRDSDLLERNWRKLVCQVVRRALFGFSIAYCIRVCIRLVTTLFKLKQLGLLRSLKLLLSQLLHPLNFQYGAFLGSLLGLFEASMRLTHLLKMHRVTRSLLSGGVAGLSLLWLPGGGSSGSRLGVALFVLVRALELSCRFLFYKCIRSHLSPVVSSCVEEYSPTLLMAVASTPVIWCWLFARDTLDPAYLAFLDAQGAKGRPVQDSFAQLHIGPGLHADTFRRLNQQRAREGVSPLTLSASSTSSPPLHIGCDVLHPSTPSCTLATIQFFMASLRRALPVYVPVYLIPLILFRLRSVIRSPLSTLSPTMKNIARSTLFLSSYCTTCWWVADVLSQAVTQRKPLNTLPNNVVAGLSASWLFTLAPGFCGGLMVIFEKPSRRLELALYVAAQALPCTYRALQQSNKLTRDVPQPELLLFVLAATVLLGAYGVQSTAPHSVDHAQQEEQEAYLLRSSYRTALDFFFERKSADRPGGNMNEAPKLDNTPSTASA